MAKLVFFQPTPAKAFGAQARRVLSLVEGGKFDKAIAGISETIGLEKTAPRVAQLAADALSTISETQGVRKAAEFAGQLYEANAGALVIKPLNVVLSTNASLHTTLTQQYTALTEQLPARDRKALNRAYPAIVEGIALAKKAGGSRPRAIGSQRGGLEHAQR